MRCPHCGYNGSRVPDSRPIHEGKAIRRRRECEDCSQRFTTFEMIEEKPVIVIKKDGSREEFNREKLLRGLMRACEKRPVPIERLEELVMNIERTLRERDQLEISTSQIGEMVLDRLIDVDEVAYVRFASVYRQFKDMNMFVKELEDLLNRTRRTSEKEKSEDS